ncbi:FAD-dependent oxidoreductase [Sphingomonas sp. AP4-R1]|nr:FAD-dependent oxidoreductase [Sphingomonas sp. AP4-R1]
MLKNVVIVGGGFSGALQAVNLLRHDGPRAILIERRPEVGRGLAYTAADPNLLLNVRAGNMSALPDEPRHFVEWLDRRGLPSDGFVPRVIYGEYLAELLAAAREAAPDRLEIVRGDAVAAAFGDGVTVALADGRSIAADALVLALGNLPPLDPGGLDPRGWPPGWYAPDPWSASIADDLEDQTVLIVGTGLTMIDAALVLDARGFRGRMVALSRRGLVPRAHAGGSVAQGLQERPPIELSALARQVRARARETGWRAAVDELRPYTQGMWRAASPEQRGRFVRHLRPWWEVHRHRLAPAVADRLDALRASGRLSIVAGKTQDFAFDGDRIRVRWRPRGNERSEVLSVRRVINCSGPQIDLDRTTEPLLLDLLRQGRIAADSMRLGLATNASAQALNAKGEPSDRLYALGPLTRGTFWEITAVPDIRHQTWSLARLLSNAHWVGGEGL